MPFGRTSDGAPTHLFTMTGDGGILVRVSDLGATLVEVHLPDRNGDVRDVALGYDSAAGYQSRANPYFGATVGRAANRIAGAEFRLDGQAYTLTPNEPPHALHGGPDRGLSKVLWELVDATDNEVDLVYTSPDGEEGYPGRLEVTARYQLRGAALEVRYRAVTDAATPVNLTNHAYWNLGGAGHGTILDHELEIPASRFTPTDDELIPTGDLAPVIDTALDFQHPRRIGQRIDEVSAPPSLGYDHYLLLDDGSRELRPAARLRDPVSGRQLVLETDQPGLQLYTGNRLNGHPGKNDAVYDRFGGVCLEAQYPSDAVHRPEFPSIILRPGETYEHNSVFRFTTD